MKYRKLKPWKYQLTEPLIITLDFLPPKTIETEFILFDAYGTNGRLFLQKYYAWDGASGPCIDTKDVMRASLVHDSLSQLMRLGLLDYKVYRKLADRELYRICLEDGMCKFRATYIYLAVRLFGLKSALPKLDNSIVYEI